MKTSEEEPRSELGMFFVGALAGLGLAFLLAPEAGTESRRKIGHWLNEHSGAGHEILVKLKKMLHLKSNGVVVDGRTKDARRHKRRFGV